MDEHGHRCDVAPSLADADIALLANRFDVLILDLGLPDGDGLEWLRTRRLSEAEPPALILTARGALEDRINGLDAGAGDYLVKPFALDELAARLRALRAILKLEIDAHMLWSQSALPIEHPLGAASSVSP